MCTIAWLPRAGGFTLWHSRDEQRRREPGLPPRVERGAGLAWIAPADTEAGGTWVGVNTAGVVTGIANHFAGSRLAPPAHVVSRGLLVRSLLGLPSVRQVARTLSAMALAPYQPFTLVSLEPGSAPVVLRWDRRELGPVEPAGEILLVTSAGGQGSIEAARRTLFGLLEGGTPDPATIERLYRAPPAPDGASIAVDRTEVATVSLTRIEVTPGEVAMIHTPGSPWATAPGARVRLARSGAG